MAVGYSARKRDGNRDALPIFQTRGIAPAAGFASTVEDLARFASWQVRLLGGGEDEVLRAATLREMHRVHWMDPDWKTTRGLGFRVKRMGDATFVEHGGRCPGYTTQVTVQPDSKLGVIVLTNAIGAEVDLYVGRAFELIGRAIADVKADPEGAPEREPALNRYVGIYESIWGHAAVVRWGDGLATVGLGSRDPKQSMETLVRDGDHVFRRVRKDDGTLGERVVFDVADDGVVTRIGRDSNWMVKVR
jgi:CubicO group peptidase (beta-lactamase class C family)